MGSINASILLLNSHSPVVPSVKLGSGAVLHNGELTRGGILGADVPKKGTIRFWARHFMTRKQGIVMAVCV